MECWKSTTVPKKPVYIQLQYKDEFIHNIITQRLKNAVKKTFFAAKLVILNKTRSMLRPSAKGKAPVLDTSNCIYEFTCICGSKYVGRTERYLSTRIKEHLPKWLLQSEEKIPKSSITKHLLDTKHSVDPKVAFRVINKQTRSKSLKYAELCAIIFEKHPYHSQKTIGELRILFNYSHQVRYIYSLPESKRLQLTRLKNSFQLFSSGSIHI